MIGDIDWKIALLLESATVNDAIRSLEISGLKLVVVVTHESSVWVGVGITSTTRKKKKPGAAAKHAYSTSLFSVLSCVPRPRWCDPAVGVCCS